MPNDIITITIAIAAIVIALATLIVQMWTNRNQFKMQTFITYTQRYHDIFSGLDADVLSSNFNSEGLNEERVEQAKRGLRSYFDMCSEQYHMWKSGMVGRKTWKLWKGGMKATANKKHFTEYWNALQEGKGVGYQKKFNEFMSELIENGPAS